MPNRDKLVKGYVNAEFFTNLADAILDGLTGGVMSCRRRIEQVRKKLLVRRAPLHNQVSLILLLVGDPALEDTVPIAIAVNVRANLTAQLCQVFVVNIENLSLRIRLRERNILCRLASA